MANEAKAKARNPTGDAKDLVDLVIAYAKQETLEPLKGLGKNATLHLAEGADHSFHVLKSSGRNDREVMAEILDALVAWVDKLVPRSG